jgi:hypothetical protein
MQPIEVDIFCEDRQTYTRKIIVAEGGSIFLRKLSNHPEGYIVYRNLQNDNLTLYQCENFASQVREDHLKSWCLVMPVIMWDSENCTDYSLLCEVT